MNPSTLELQEKRKELDRLDRRLVENLRDRLDTAAAARQVREVGDPRLAAIASEEATELSGLGVLARDIAKNTPAASGLFQSISKPGVHLAAMSDRHHENLDLGLPDPVHDPPISGSPGP